MSAPLVKEDTPMNRTNLTRQFSIFNPAITFEHREFYEKIVAKLNGIFPICSQGQSSAVEVSENETEQQQVADLMKRVENFGYQLLEDTKSLFDQFYQAFSVAFW